LQSQTIKVNHTCTVINVDNICLDNPIIFGLSCLLGRLFESWISCFSVYIIDTSNILHAKLRAINQCLFEVTCYTNSLFIVFIF